MKAFILAFLFLLISGCDRPNSNPELMDPIYSDIQKDHEEAKRNIQEQEKQVEEFKQMLTQAKPQTGQSEYAKKKLKEANDGLEKFKQKERYLLIHANSRKSHDRESYFTAYKNKTPWPDPNEYLEYQKMKGAPAAPQNWSITKRLEEAGLAKKIKKPAKTEEH